MDRREFVKIGLSAAAISALPTSILASEYYAAEHVIDLPPVMHHVRHGMFNLDQPHLMSIPGFPSIKNIQRNRFLHNGFSADDAKDLQLISIQTTDNQAITLNIQADKAKALGNSELNDFDLTGENSNSLRISDQLDARFLRLQKGHSIALNSTKCDMLIPVRGTFSSRYQSCSEDQAILAPPKTSMHIKSESNETLILILSSNS